MAKADIFLRLEGAKTGVIKGESNVLEHLDEIEISSWSWSMKGPAALGGIGSVAKTSLSEIQFSKGTDSATTPLMSVMRNNELIKKGVLSVRKAGAVPPIDYLVVTIENGRLTAHSIGTEGPGSPTLVEHFSIAFEKIEVAYAPQQGTGSKSAKSTFSAVVSQS